MDITANMGAFVKYVETAVGTDITTIPQRWIEPGTVHDLYVEYSSLEDAPMSYITFWRRWRSLWRHVLRFKPKSEFAQCNECNDLRMQIREETDMQKKYVAVEQLRGHHKLQWGCRAVFWTMKSCNPFRMLVPVLVVVFDGMEQSKWAIPRMRGGGRTLIEEVQRLHTSALRCAGSVGLLLRVVFFCM